jgi:hypothetical protein
LFENGLISKEGGQDNLAVLHLKLQDLIVIQHSVAANEQVRMIFQHDKINK